MFSEYNVELYIDFFKYLRDFNKYWGFSFGLGVWVYNEEFVFWMFVQ